MNIVFFKHLIEIYIFSNIKNVLLSFNIMHPFLINLPFYFRMVVSQFP